MGKETNDKEDKKETEDTEQEAEVIISLYLSTVTLNVRLLARVIYLQKVADMC